MGPKLSRKASKKVRTAIGAVPGFEMLEQRTMLSTYFVATNGVDGAAGSLDAPWRNIQYALDRAQPGDTINVRGGTYGNGITVRKANITLQAHQNEVVKIAGSFSTGAQVAVRIDMDAKNVTLRNLDISGGTFYALKTESDWGWGGPTVRAPSGLLIDNVKLHNSGRDVVKIVPGTSHVTIQNSVIHSSGKRDGSNADGIDAVNAPYFTLRDSHIYDTATDGIYVKGGSVGTLIERNIVERTGFSGILLGQDTDWEFFDHKNNPTLYENIDGIVRNNIVRDTKYAGIGMWGALRPQIYNNTIINASTTGSMGGIFLTRIGHYGPPTYSTVTSYRSNTDATIKNNVVIMASNAPAVLLRPGSLDGKLEMSNNLYYRAAGPVRFVDERVGFNGNLAAWQGRGIDANSREANPQLASNGSLTSSSPAIDAGAVLTGFATDFLRNARPSGKAWDIGAFEFNGTPSTSPDPTPTPNPNPNPNPTPNPDPTPTPTWENTAFGAQTGVFQMLVDAKPLYANSDTVIGLSNGPATWFTSLAAIVRFNTSGTIDARNGDTYSAANTVAYTANTNYRVRMVVNMQTRKYDAFVTPAGGQEVLIAAGHSFRAEQANATSLNNQAKYNLVGDVAVSNLGVGPWQTPAPEPTPEPPPPAPSPDPAPTPSWQNTPIANQTGLFTIRFDARPVQAGSDVAIGLSQGPATWFTSLAPIVRFNAQNQIDARNGGAYAAQANVPYTANTTYSFRLVVNLTTRTYDAFVTPAGGQEILLGAGHAFRTEQAGVTSLSNVAKYNLEGDATVSNITVTPIAAPAPAPTGTGLRGEYFDNMDLTNLKVTRTDATVNFNWGTGSPASTIHRDTFSVRWTGQIEPQHSERYTFFTRSDDGVRLWVNGQLIIDAWRNQAFTERSGQITLEAGRKYDIRIEYYENAGSAAMQLLWSSPSLLKQIVPQNRLYAPATATATPPAAPAPVVSSAGLKAEYFNDLAMVSAPVVTRVDTTVNFDWALASPAAGVNQDFAVRWTGQIAPKFSETYTFHTTTDDGVRLWVDGKLIIDNWRNQSAREVTGTLALQAGRSYNIRMEYFDAAAEAVAKLSWSSASQVKEIVPASVLFQPLA